MTDPVSALTAEASRLRHQANRAGLVRAEELRREAAVVERCVAIVERVL